MSENGTEFVSLLRSFGKWLLIFLASGVVSNLLFDISGWLLAAAFGCVLGGAIWANKNPDAVLLGKTGSTIKKPLLVASIMMALFGIAAENKRVSDDAISSAKAILATREKDPAVFRSGLAAAPKSVLEAMKELAPEAYTAEMARREAAGMKQLAEKINAETQQSMDVMASPETNAEASDDPHNDPTRQAVWIARAQTSLEGTLKDASSVKYQQMFYNTADVGGNKAPIACGEFNAKNGFGGYTGFQKFIYVGDALGVITPDMMAGSEFASTWNKLCISKFDNRD